MADITIAPELTADIDAGAAIADKGYDSQEFVEALEAEGIELVENAIQQLKEWRGVATRYAKRASSFLAIVQIRCVFQWLKIL